MDKLKERRDDLKNRAEQEARRTGAEVTSQASGWMKRVASLATEAVKFQRSFEDRSFCIAGLCLGNNVVELLRQAERLAEEGKDLSDHGQLTQQRGPDTVEQIRSEISNSTMVGAEESLQKIKDYIEDEDIGIIVICGMGGVGKTSLLKVINNEFLTGEACRDKFEVSIWVTVSREAKDTSKIMKAITDRLGLPEGSSNDRIFFVLSTKRFILLLDDVWEKVDLVEIGIPLPMNLNNKSKVLFTTRSEEVCHEMVADEMVKVGSLDAERSWRLFRSKFGRAAPALDNPEIQPLAKEVVARCGGLPISLVTVGRAMAKAKTPDDWRDAINKLDHRPAELSPGMHQVLQSLEYSFEMLKDEASQNCLLYCALFPEDYDIPKVQILDYCICEGFLDSEDFDEYDIEETRRRGSALISKLQNACLLEVTLDETLHKEVVTLHDTVRDMALWIAKHEFVVLAGHNVVASQIPHSSIWERAKRISLMYNRSIEAAPFFENLNSCPNLTTLLLPHSQLFQINVPKGFFNSMPALRVLDLTRTGLLEFPIEITSLTCLQYLCLSDNSGFTSLPVELGNLTNLRQLILKETGCLRYIPREAISRLSRLQVLDMGWSGYDFDDTRPWKLELSDLANLRRLVEFHLPDKYCSWRSLDVIVASPVLGRSTRNIYIRASCDASVSPPPSGDTISEQIGRLSGLRRLDLLGEPSDPVMGELQLYPISQLQNLEVLRIEHFTEEAKISFNISSHCSFPRLRDLWIDCCDCSELTWVGRLPDLVELYIMDCQGLREVLQLDGGGHDHLVTPFPKLTTMYLYNLPSLTSISMSTLPFPSLERLVVRRCPRLKRLPFGPLSAKNLASIEGEEAWWDGLEWNNHADKQSFSSNFQKKSDD
ncbi:hypothetical protein Taro_038176 [Colocasia esculenta]|uniref:Uncharacterized protein n=1 Tax=Colocasia esculenta TaxID=4460 RepID=A0A843WF26_COLES|nr:hypothetical protein [Colocasia esculenta]